MIRKTSKAHALLAAILALLAWTWGCEEEDNRLDLRQFYGGWLLCLDEDCSTVGNDGLAFDEDNWFHRLSVTGMALTPEEAAAELEAGQRECCWRTTETDVIIDYDDYYQHARIRLIDETHLQIESLMTRDFDDSRETQVEVVWLEGEEFDPASCSYIDGICWTRYWEPLGKAVRVLTPEQVAQLPNEPETE